MCVCVCVCENRQIPRFDKICDKLALFRKHLVIYHFFSNRGPCFSFLFFFSFVFFFSFCFCWNGLTLANKPLNGLHAHVKKMHDIQEVSCMKKCKSLH